MLSSPTVAKEVLTEIEASEYLGLSRASLRRARMQGQRATHISSIPYLRLGRAIRYRRTDLDRWLDDCRVGGETAPPADDRKAG